MYAEYGAKTQPGAQFVGKPAPPPIAIAPLLESAEGMERAISEAMSLAEMLADRLTCLMTPTSPPTTNDDCKLARSYSPLVESVNRQRSRVDAVSAQLRDILARLEV